MALEDNIRHVSAAGVFDAIPEIKEDMETAPGPVSSLEFLDGLSRSETPEEAITFAAYLLTPRLAVWWAHECLVSEQAVLDATDEHMLELSEQWVANADEPSRYAAMDAASDAPAKSPGVWVALAAAWSGGSFSGPDADPVPVPEFLCGRAVSAAILSLLARIDITARADRIAGFVSMAQVLAKSD